MIKTTVFKGRHLVYGALIGRDHRLYVPGWEMLNMYRGIIENDAWYMAPWHGKLPTISIAYNNLEEPIAAAILVEQTEIHAFCRVAARRQGYASAAVKALHPLSYRQGFNPTSAASAFWAKNDIEH